MESEEPFGDEMPDFDICGTVLKELFKDIDVLDIDEKTETAASSENSGRAKYKIQLAEYKIQLRRVLRHGQTTCTTDPAVRWEDDVNRTPKTAGNRVERKG